MLDLRKEFLGFGIAFRVNKSPSGIETPRGNTLYHGIGITAYKGNSHLIFGISVIFAILSFAIPLKILNGGDQ
jgi:hypothetical protein